MLVLGFVIAVEASLSASGNSFALLLFEGGFKVSVRAHFVVDFRFGNVTLTPLFR